MKVLEGKLTAKGMKVAIVASRFNEFITSKLIGGAEDCLLRHGAESDNLTLVWVPGAFEIPLALKFRWLHKSLPKAANMTPLCALVP